MPKITSALMTSPGRRSELHLNSKKRCAAGFAFAGGPLRDAADDVREYVASRNPGAARQKGNLPRRWLALHAVGEPRGGVCERCRRLFFEGESQCHVEVTHSLNWR
jgi:hypothetical protein